MSPKDVLLFFLKSSIILCYTFKSAIHFFVIHFFFFFIKLGFIFPLWLFNCSTTICWKDYPSSIELLCTFVKTQLERYVWVYFWVLFSHCSMCLSLSVLQSTGFQDRMPSASLGDPGQLTFSLTISLSRYVNRSSEPHRI